MVRRATWLLLVVALSLSCQKSGEAGFGEGRQTFRALLALRDQISKEFQETVSDVSVSEDKRMTIKLVNSPFNARTSAEKQQRADAIADFVLKNYKQPLSSVAIQFVSDTGANAGEVYVGRASGKP